MEQTQLVAIGEDLRASVSARAGTQQHLGVVHDAATVGETGVSIGFGIARLATNVGFGIASVCIRAPAAVTEHAVGQNPLSSGLRGIDKVVGAAQQITNVSQDFAKGTTQMSIGAAKFGLRAFGAQEGQALRLAFGDEMAEIVIGSASLIRRFAGPLRDVPRMELLRLVEAWGLLQKAACVSHPRAVTDELTATPKHIKQWMRYSAAAYGRSYYAGLINGMPIELQQRVARAQELGVGLAEQSLAAVGLDGDIDVLAFDERTNEIFAPGYLVAVDNDLGVVVVAFRGTSSLADALTDLACEPVSLQLCGRDGLAHRGMFESARRLDAKVSSPVKAGLARLREAGRAPAVVVCGHSLGAGVASLLTALWLDADRLPGVDLRCCSFACPQVLDAGLAAAMAPHTTSLVVADDLVPRFSLATVMDLRQAMLVLHNPEAYGLDPELSASEVLSLDAARDGIRLAGTHTMVRAEACNYSGRLCPAGRIVHMGIPGRAPREIAQSSVDELVISRDMALAHMPCRYLAAIEECRRPSAMSIALESHL